MKLVVDIAVFCGDPLSGSDKPIPPDTGKPQNAFDHSTLCAGVSEIDVTVFKFLWPCCDYQWGRVSMTMEAYSR